MQQQPATSHEEGVPPAAATAARIAQGHAVAEQPPAADDDDAPRAAPLPLGDDGFPDEALAVVCGFLGLRELGRLACAARRFTEPTLTEPGGSGGAGGTKLSPIEEGARLQLAAGGGSGGGGGGIAAERLEGETWVRALWRVQYRLQFTSCGPEVVLSEEGSVATNSSGSSQSAVCAEYPMVEGAHYVEMTFLTHGYGAYMGVVGQGFDAAGGGEAHNFVEGWVLDTSDGGLRHVGKWSYWEGMPQDYEMQVGDVVGLLLDLGQRTLSVCLNGAWRGAMVAPGMQDAYGRTVAPLAGPLRWAVDVYGGSSVRIERKSAPPTSAVAE